MVSMHARDFSIGDSSDGLLGPPRDEADEGSRPQGALAPLLLRGAALLLVAAWILSFVLTVMLGKEPAWPLRTISQYAAHYPAIYFFRGLGTATAVLLAEAGLLLRHRGARWPLLLVPAAACLAGAACVSCTEAESNDVHTTFAICAFILLASAQSAAAASLRRAVPALAWAEGASLGCGRAESRRVCRRQTRPCALDQFLLLLCQ